MCKRSQLSVDDSGLAGLTVNFLTSEFWAGCLMSEMGRRRHAGMSASDFVGHYE
jgi:hypothetical protein